MKQIYKQLVTGVLTLALIAVMIPTSAHAITIDAYGTLNGTPVTGVENASSTALHTSLATLISGENQLLNRLMTIIMSTCIATSTDGIIDTGSGVITSYFLGGQASGAGVIIYDGLSSAGSIMVNDQSYPAIATAPAPFRAIGAGYTTGVFLDVIGSTTINICFL